MANYHSWLQQVVAPYFDPGRVFRDVDMALTTFPTLRPKTDNFTRIGVAQLLICLFGPLPCGPHNIPIEVWIPRQYSREAPLLYIVPSPGIQLRPNTFVDNSGRFFHALLQVWPNRPDATILELLRVTIGALSVDPPFFPGSGRVVYPTSTPQMPPGSNYSHSPNNPMISGTNSFMAGGGGGGGNPKLNTNSSPDSSTIRSSTFNPTHRNMAPPPSYGSGSGNPPITINPMESLPQLRMAVRERLKERYRKFQNELALESDRLLAENTQLSKGEKSLADGSARVNAEIVQLEKTIESVREQKERLIAIGTSDTTSTIDIDNLIVPQGPVARQIIYLVADDLAIQDVLYAIGKVFTEGKIVVPLYTYLRHVRDLAREQFMTKALLAKIRREFPIIN